MIITSSTDCSHKREQQEHDKLIDLTEASVSAMWEPIKLLSKNWGTQQ